MVSQAALVLGDICSSDAELRPTECFLLQKASHNPQGRWGMADFVCVWFCFFRVLSFEQSGHGASRPDEVRATPLYKRGKRRTER